MRRAYGPGSDRSHQDKSLLILRENVLKTLQNMQMKRISDRKKTKISISPFKNTYLLSFAKEDSLSSFKIYFLGLLHL